MSQALTGYCQWPGMQQVFEVKRKVSVKKSGKQREEVVYGITGLGRGESRCRSIAGDGEATLGHREPVALGQRSLTFDEDRSQVRVGSIPQVMTTLRNTAGWYDALDGRRQHCRWHAGHSLLSRETALALIGVPGRN
ncbi:MAG: hypothetical protein WKF84_06305 [Pyrinomonadaceae bacterium]